VYAQSEVANQAIALQFLDRAAEPRIVRPRVVPDVILQDVDGFGAKSLADQLCILENMVGRKNVLQFIFWRCWPLHVLRWNLRCGLDTFAFTARPDLDEKTVVFPVSVSPRRIEEIAAQVDRQLHGGERLMIVRTAPTAHAPEPMGNVCHFEIRTAKSAIFH